MHDLGTGSGLGWTLLGAVGGGAKVFVQLLALEKLPSKSKIFWLLTANMFVSGFSGFLGAVLATKMTSDNNLHVVAAGVAGYMGVAALDLFAKWFKEHIK